MSNSKLNLVQNVVQSIQNPGWVSSNGTSIILAKGWCQKDVRIWVQATFGSKYDSAVVAPTDTQGTAIHAAHRFLKYFPQYSFTLSSFQRNGLKLQSGDIVYKTKGSGQFGHVGIAVEHPASHSLVIGENSSTAVGRVRGALGYRTLSQFGALGSDNGIVIVRLPGAASIEPTLPATKPFVLVLNDKAVSGAYLKEGHWFATAPNVLAALGVDPSRPMQVVQLLEYMSMSCLPEKMGNHLSTTGKFYLYAYPTH